MLNLALCACHTEYSTKSGCEQLECFGEKNKKLFCQMRHLGSLSPLCLTRLS